jgi:tetratricopeptide (TPR) repeat protein
MHLLKQAADLAARAGMHDAARSYREALLLRLLERYSPEKAGPGLCGQIASTLEQLGRPKQAEPYLKKALDAATEEDAPELRAQLASLYAKLGQTDGAVRELRAVIEAVEPKVSVRFRTQLARLLEKDGRYEQAEKALAGILEVPGSKAAGHAELRPFHKRRANLDTAVHPLRHAVKLADTRHSIRYRIRLGLAYLDAAQYENAERVLSEAYRMFPENAAVNNALAWFYAERGVKLNTALALARKALTASPKNPYYIDSLGWIYYKQGRKKAALEQLIRAAALADDSTICDHLGDVYMDLGQPDKAAKLWRRSLKLEPDSPKVRDKLDKLENKN